MDKKTGKHNRNAGALFEKIISAACRKYSEMGIAEIEKTPEPMRPVSKPDASGKFIAVFTKQAQPDFKGTLRGGKSIVIEAKHTDADRMYRRVVTDAQAESMNRHCSLDAQCYVLASFGLKHFYLIPWAYFRDMKAENGRQYVAADDLSGYEVFISNGMLCFLGIGAKHEYHGL